MLPIQICTEMCVGNVVGNFYSKYTRKFLLCLFYLQAHLHEMHNLFSARYNLHVFTQKTYCYFGTGFQLLYKYDMRISILKYTLNLEHDKNALFKACFIACYIFSNLSGNLRILRQ